VRTTIVELQWLYHCTVQMISKLENDYCTTSDCSVYARLAHMNMLVVPMAMPFLQEIDKTIQDQYAHFTAHLVQADSSLLHSRVDLIS
jgi:hypothetical protein